MATPDMKYTYLGDSGLEVSRLVLGCANFGGEESWMVGDRETARRIIDRAIEAGITTIDTANVYSTGESERIVGDAIAGHDRSKLVIATKVFGDMWDGPNGGGLSKKHVIDQAEASLDRLGTDYIDLYQLHRWDPDTPIEETLAALDHLVDRGVVRYIGASTMAGWQLMQALERSRAENYERFVAIQPEYSVVRRHEEVNMLPVAESEGLGVLTYSPLAAGFLSGKYDFEHREELAEVDSWRDFTIYDREAVWTVLEEVRAIASRKDVSPVQVSLAWLLETDGVDAPIIGPKSISHLTAYLDALAVSLSEDEMAALERPIDPSWSPDLT